MSEQTRNKLSEGITKVFQKIIGKQNSSLVIPDKNFTGKFYPPITFQSMAKVLNGDPDIASSIEFITDVAVGGGFENTADESYTSRGASGLSALELIDQRCEEFDVDNWTHEVATDLVAYGNAVTWIRNPRKIAFLARVLPATFLSFNFAKDNGLLFESLSTQWTTFPADELIFGCQNRIEKTPVGVGIMQKICSTLSYTSKTGKAETRPSFADIKTRIQHSMLQQIEKFSGYNELWSLPGVPADKQQEYSTAIKNLENDRLAYFPSPDVKGEGKVLPLIPERMRGLDFYADCLWNSFYLALSTPYPKLILGGGAGFTEASARAAETIGERRVFRMQRYMKRLIERNLYTSWLLEEGLDPVKAKVQLNWRINDKPKAETLLPILLQTWQEGGMSDEEWRKVIRGYGVSLSPTFMRGNVNAENVKQ